MEAAIRAGYPAGQVLDSKFEDDETDKTLRIAFDFDGVLAGDESETIMQASGLSEFHAHEVKNVMQPHNPGPLKEFMVRISKIQSVEEKHKSSILNTKTAYASRSSQPAMLRLMSVR